MEQKINLSLSVEQVNTILAGLSELSFKVSSTIITEIHKQAEDQLNPPETKKK